MNIKRILSDLLVLCLAAAIAGCTETGGTDVSSEASSAAEVSSTASSEEAVSVASSEEAPTGPIFVTDADGYVDVDYAVQTAGLTMNHDVSACFPEDAKGYLINGGTAIQPYLVDKATLRRLTTLPCKGTGYVKWLGYNVKANATGTVDAFDGVAPVSRLNDPVFMAACLPSEANTFMSERVNAGNHFPLTDDQAYIVAIGAVYRNEDNKPADDAAVTVCISDFTLLLHTEANGWFPADNMTVLPKVNANRMYYLPWSLQNTIGSFTIPDGQITPIDDHTEIALTGSLFNGTAYGNSQIQEACLHFWANNKYFKTHFSLTGSQIDGVVVAYRAWVKEADAAGKYVAAAADIKVSSTSTKKGADHQVFASYNYLLTNEPRWVFGHNVGPKKVDSILTPADSEYIQKELLSWK